MDTVSISKSDVPSYLQSGEFYRSLSDDEDPEQQLSIPNNTLKADLSVKNNPDLHHLLTSLRFWGVGGIQNEVIKYCLSDLESPCYDILQEFAQDFPYVAALMSVLSVSNEQKMLTAVKSGMLEIVCNLPVNMAVQVHCCCVAAEAGNLEILQCLHERGGELNSAVLYAALEGGKGLACVQYLRAQGIQWSHSSLTTAVKAGNQECILFALQHGCQWEGSVYEQDSSLWKDKHLGALKYAIHLGYPVTKYSAKAAAGNGAIKCLKVLHEVNCPWDDSVSTFAARNGHLACLQYLHENGCPWDKYTVLWAVNGNYIECVQYALQQGCPIHRKSCSSASKNGYLPILQCLHQAGVPWDEDTCTFAAANGRLNCLQYAHEHGAPWDEETFSWTLERGQLECLKYLLENGCPIDMKECQELIAHGLCFHEAVEMVRSFYSHV